MRQDGETSSRRALPKRYRTWEPNPRRWRWSLLWQGKQEWGGREVTALRRRAGRAGDSLSLRLRRMGGWLSTVPLFGALTLSLLALVVAGLMVVLITNGIGNHHWRFGIAPMTWAERLKYAAATVTAFGATVALVVNYRKQRDSEQGRFATSFADACAQLGGEAPAVRLGGVYALAALADRQSGRERRQQCIDALCAYLRLPYDPNTGNDHTATSTVEFTSVAGVKTTITNTYRPADREVRLTIIRIIRDHLRDPDASATWVGHPLDFTGAVFDGGDFTRAHFTAEINFERAMFSTRNFSFEEVKFLNGLVSFAGATFSSAHVSFDRVEVLGGQLLFRDAILSSAKISFEQANFSSGVLQFLQVGFDRSRLSFRGAKFSGTLVSFRTTVFGTGEIIFWDAILRRGCIEFVLVIFDGTNLLFQGAEFENIEMMFLNAQFRRGFTIFGMERPAWFADLVTGKVHGLTGDGQGNPIPFQLRGRNSRDE